jgi:hypothetical protein
MKMKMKMKKLLLAAMLLLTLALPSQAVIRTTRYMFVPQSQPYITSLFIDGVNDLNNFSSVEVHDGSVVNLSWNGCAPPGNMCGTIQTQTLQAGGWWLVTSSFPIQLPPGCESSYFSITVAAGRLTALSESPYCPCH